MDQKAQNFPRVFYKNVIKLKIKCNLLLIKLHYINVRCLIKNQIKKKLEKLGYKSKENKEWVKKFIKNHNMEYLTKEIIDDLVDNIFVLENGDLRVVFKYQDEFFEAKDFINKNKCAIM